MQAPTPAGAVPFLKALPRPIPRAPLRAQGETPDSVPRIGRRRCHGVVPLHEGVVLLARAVSATRFHVLGHRLG